MKRISIWASMLVSLMLAGCGQNEAASIGIIGGADGPTAIFVTTCVNWWAIATTVIVVAAVITSVIILIKNKKKL